MDKQLSGVNALAVGELMPTKANAVLLGNYLAEQVRDGFRKSLETIASLRATKLAIETALSFIEPEAHEEISRYGRQGAEILGAKLEVVEAGIKYDYSADAEWLRLKAEAEKTAELLKSREQFLKGLPKEMADPETGEMVAPPVRTSTTTLKVTLGK